jgi:hypothetical protein
MYQNQLEQAMTARYPILWNQQLQTDEDIHNHKLDIIIHRNKKGTCLLMDTTISETEM